MIVSISEIEHVSMPVEIRHETGLIDSLYCVVLTEAVCSLVPLVWFGLVCFGVIVPKYSQNTPPSQHSVPSYLQNMLY
jgi:hypothetical protein